MKENFISSLHDRKTCLVFLSNSKGMKVGITNYGARIVSLCVPDNKEQISDVVLGYNSINDYLTSSDPYFGATIGRYANRIAGGSFWLKGKKYELDKNEGVNHLHGGSLGFHNVVWDVLNKNKESVSFRYFSRHKESGYPGNLNVTVSYKLTDEGELIIDYSANTDKTTVINLTNHTYFNLSGAGSGSIGDHRLLLNADYFTPVNVKMIPTGQVKNVDQTPFDFTEEKAVGRDWDIENEQLNIAGGYDHNFILNNAAEGNLKFAARIKDSKSGRSMDVHTTEPGVQFYTANALSGEDIGREGLIYKPRTAFCIETQQYPDSPNQSQFSGVVLEPQKEFKSTTTYKFSW